MRTDVPVIAQIPAQLDAPQVDEPPQILVVDLVQQVLRAVLQGDLQALAPQVVQLQVVQELPAVEVEAPVSGLEVQLGAVQQDPAAAEGATDEREVQAPVPGVVVALASRGEELESE